MTQNSSIGLPKSSIARNGANTDITSMSGLTGALKAPTAILDANSNNVMTLTGVASAVNYVNINNSVASAAPSLEAKGTDTDISISLLAKNTGGVLCQSPTSTFPLYLQPNSATNSFTISFGCTTLTATRSCLFPNLDGTVAVNQALVGVVAHAGGGAGSATLLSTSVTNISTCATAGDSVILSNLILLMPIYIRNSGVASCNVFPPTGGQIDALGTNNPLAVASGTSVILIQYSATQAYTYSVL